MRRPSTAIAAVGLLVLLSGCPASPTPGPAVPAGSAAPTSATTPTASTGTPAASPPSANSPSSSPPITPSATRTPSPKPSATPEPDPISLPALFDRSWDGGELERGRLLEDAGPYKRYLVSYRSDGLRVSGIMNVPDGRGPFPVLVLNHGYINPRTYFPGQGMPREQDYLARQGYVVLHTDYRGHASSDDDPDVDYELRLPYVRDTINAVYAVKRSGLDYLDGDRVGWLGRSMGGGVTLRALAAVPGLVDAAVVYASVSSLEADNWRQWYRGNDERAGTNRRIERTYGLPDQDPAFWRAASARPYFPRVTEPVQVHQGTADDTCPPQWADATVDALRQAGKDVEFYRYRGEGHTFEGQWQTSIERTTAFFDRHLR